MPAPPPPPRVPRPLALLEVLLVLALLATPGALLLAGRDGHAAVREIEKRTPAPPPAWSGATELPRWLDGLHAWFRDALPLRRAFVSSTNRALLALGESGEPSVIVGRDGWFFLRATLEDHLRTRTLPPQRFALMCRATVARAAWTRRQGTRYVLLVPPNKASVYPHKMPAALPAGRGPTLADRFVAKLREHDVLDVVDPQRELVLGRSSGQVFYRTDSHWNLRGALVAVRELHALLERRVPGFVSRDWSGFALRAGPLLGGDLVQVLGLHELIRERVPVPVEPWRPGWRTWRPPPGVKLPAGTRVRVFEDPRGHGTAVLVHDSFGAQLLPWVGRGFARFLEVTRPDDAADRDALHAALVDAERPDVFIEEMVERAFNVALPDRPARWR